MASRIEVLFIGNDFYNASGTMMSSIYKVLPNGSYERYDFGFLQRDVEAGHEIHIRKATIAEKAPFRKKLEEIQADN